NPTTETPLWSQDDQYPQDGRISTTSWEVATLYRDVFTLPVQSIPAGEYTLTIGLYDPDTNERLPVGEEDYFVLQTVFIPDYAK
ncbi:MAG TPA: hypothetical protein VK003_14190, partial [Oceanobacillus sp.]|nr:hypothetical protein [Oceanobacillus sp.]